MCIRDRHTLRRCRDVAVPSVEIGLSLELSDFHGFESVDALLGLRARTLAAGRTAATSCAGEAAIHVPVQLGLRHNGFCLAGGAMVIAAAFQGDSNSQFAEFASKCHIGRLSGSLTCNGSGALPATMLGMRSETGDFVGKNIVAKLTDADSRHRCRYSVDAQVDSC